MVGQSIVLSGMLHISIGLFFYLDTGPRPVGPAVPARFLTRPPNRIRARVAGCRCGINQEGGGPVQRSEQVSACV